MGVTGLFPQLKGAWRAVNLSEGARGESMGIDAYVWLHALATRHAASVVLVGDFTSVAVHSSRGVAAPLRHDAHVRLRRRAASGEGPHSRVAGDAARHGVLKCGGWV